jgi:hypothetical protein
MSSADNTREMQREKKGTIIQYLMEQNSKYEQRNLYKKGMKSILFRNIIQCEKGLQHAHERYLTKKSHSQRIFYAPINNINK